MVQGTGPCRGEVTACWCGAMSSGTKAALIVAVAAFLGAFFFWFGFSDLLAPAQEQSDLMQTKPWRPFGRLMFSIVMLAITIATAGLLLRRLRNNRG